jgi:hypothetical protein
LLSWPIISAIAPVAVMMSNAAVMANPLKGLSVANRKKGASFSSWLLKGWVEELVRHKSADGRAVPPDDCIVVVSVTERSQRNLIKRYHGSEIDSAVDQTQLECWGQYFQRGKSKLRVNLSFNYVQVSASSASNVGGRGDKKGTTSS